EVEIMPAPKGTGLNIEKECQKILKVAGITDVWSKTTGCTTTKVNVVNACFNALKELMQTKIRPENYGKMGIVEGKQK
ncbi:30S ribosomal protein S5, partial [Candidatus Woesearchaeota archaeon]|nr:30S ribosomal protein S5 [Candidatus Woesearchaeota archaeon]